MFFLLIACQTSTPDHNTSSQEQAEAYQGILSLQNPNRINTENISYADCSGYTPFDQVGAVWNWEGKKGDEIFSWTVTAAGATTYDGIDVWEIHIDGSGMYSGGELWEFFTTNRWVTCETDGLHLVAESWSTTITSHDTSTSFGLERFVERPLLFPATLSRYDSWDMRGVFLPASPEGHIAVDQQGETKFSVPGGRGHIIDDTTYSVMVVEGIDQNGSDQWWYLSEDYGPLFWYADATIYQVTQFSGL